MEPGTRTAATVRALLLVLLVLALALMCSGLSTVITRADVLERRITSWGAWAPAGVIGLQMAQTVLAPVPGQLVGLASGYLFGAFWGSVYSILGTVLGSAIAMLLTRKLGRPLVERLLPQASLQRLDNGLRQSGLALLLLVFLVPFLPDDVACFAAGLTSIPMPTLMLTVLVGRTPSLVVTSWLGSSARDLTLVQWLAAASASLVLACCFLRHARQLEAHTLRITERWSSRLHEWNRRGAGRMS